MSEPSHVLQAALELTPRERAERLDAIASSLDGIDLGADWEAEIRRRVEDIDAGRVKPVEGDEVFARLERRLRER